MIYLCIYSPVCSLWFHLVYSLLPVFPVCQPCLVLTVIWVYVLVCVFLYPPCCVHRDRRPDLTVSGAPSPRFVLFVFSSFYLFPVFCLSRQASPLATSPHAADRGRYPPPAVAIPSPPAASLVPGLPLPQARRSREITPPARRWLNARRPASDSSPPDRRWLMPAGRC